MVSVHSRVRIMIMMIMNRFMIGRFFGGQPLAGHRFGQVPVWACQQRLVAAWTWKEPNQNLTVACGSVHSRPSLRRRLIGCIQIVWKGQWRTIVATYRRMANEREKAWYSWCVGDLPGGGGDYMFWLKILWLV